MKNYTGLNTLLMIDVYLGIHKQLLGTTNFLF